jgi:hypothetical protein
MPTFALATEVLMRTFIVVVVVVVVVGAIGFMTRTGFSPGLSGNGALVNRPAESATLWPYEIHTNYKGMKELPVHDVKDEAF